MDLEQAEKEASLFTTPMHNENEVLVELGVNETLDCVVSEMQEATGRMSSPMLHGLKIIVKNGQLYGTDETSPFKMWASSSLEAAFKQNNGRLIGLPIRIRRLADAQFGTMAGKVFRISDLKSVLRNIAKDAPAKA